MGILEDFPAALQGTAGFHRVGDVHEAVQVEKPGEKPGARAQRQPPHQRRQPQPPDEPGQRRPNRPQLQPHQGQEQEHPIPGLLIPYLPGAGNGAEHGLAHGKGVQAALHTGSTPLWRTGTPAQTSITVSLTAANARSMDARHLR